MQTQISSAQVQVNPQQIKTDSIHKIHQFQIDPNRKKYGNLKVLCNKNSILLSLGPKYMIFIIMTFLMAISQLSISYLAYSTISNINAFYIVFFLSLLHVGSYVVVCLSNPGIVIPNQQQNQTTSQEQKAKICSKCGVIKLQKTKHCRQCDVCIQGFDHHCGWITKCVGKRNLYKFYFFTILTPIYIIVSVLLIVVCFILNQTTNGGRSLRGNLFQ